MERDRTEREQRAAVEFADTVRDQAARFFNVMMEEMLEELRRKQPEAYHVGRDPLPEEEADDIALEVVHRVRAELGREVEDEAPGLWETEEWKRERERDRREGRSDLPR
jgi:hypothetical protein